VVQDWSVKYIYSGNTKMAMVQVKADGTEQTYYFVNNAQGSPALIADDSGAIVQKIQLDPYGNLEQSCGLFPDEQNYTGKKFEEATGLYYFNQRWYDPELGRFMGQDPAGQMNNLYQYCGNNPVNYTDPNGEFFLLDDLFYWGSLYLGLATACSTLEGLSYMSRGKSFSEGFTKEWNKFGGDLWNSIYQNGGINLGGELPIGDNPEDNPYPPGAPLESQPGAPVRPGNPGGYYGDGEPYGGGHTKGNDYYEDPGIGLLGYSPGYRPGTGEVLSKYGPRNGTYHTGVDIARGDGNFYAPFAGTVVFSGEKSGDGYGIKVVVFVPAGFSYQGNHLNMSLVRAGNQVQAGQVLGYIGNSGWQGVRSTPYEIHLHYEIYTGSYLGQRHFYNSGIM